MEIANTKIRFWGGLRTIGGTIISVQYEGSRIIFDFGLYYSPAESFSGIVKTRYNALVEDYINLNKIPPIDGLYSRKALRNLTSIIPAEDYDVKTAVFISHLHLDHIGAMGLVSPNIPVYLTEDSLKLYNAFEEIGEDVFGKRNYSSIMYDETIEIGAIKVTPIILDHDIIGACGFFIETPDIKVVYSGDLRLHGKHPEFTQEFLAKARSFKPNVLLMEGTMIDADKKSSKIKSSNKLEGINTEEQVKEMFLKRFKKNSDMVLINMSERNIERILDVIDAAKEAERKIVLQPETAYVISTLTDTKNFMIYKSEETNLILKQNKAPEWLKKVMESCEAITANDINMSPHQYVIQNSFKNLMELLDLNLSRSVYIHSNAVPLGEYDPDYNRLRDFLKKLKVEYDYIGTPGHAFHSHLKYMIDEIDPEILIPIHSFYPEKLYSGNKKQFLPEYGAEYIIKAGKAVRLTVKQ